MKNVVILVHGLFRTKASMLILGHYLKKNGFHVVYYSYRSTQHKLDEHSARFAEFLRQFAEKNSKVKMNFVTHSMGGILIREALEFLKIEYPISNVELECRDGLLHSKDEINTLKKVSMLRESRGGEEQVYKINIGRIVMLAPPNQGSKVATRFGSGWLIPKFVKPLPELRDSQDSRIHKVSIPKKVEIGVISGKFDGKVRPEEAKLEGEKEHLIVNSFHTFIMNSNNVKNSILNFLKYGSFK